MADELGMIDDIQSPETVANQDIQDLVARIDAYMNETVNCASATRDETSDHDLTRCRAMVDRFEKRFELYASDPELDLPKSHPKAMKLPAPGEIRRIQNTDLQAVVNHWAVLRVELSYSDSAERASGFKGADVNRVRAVIQKLKQLGDAIEEDPAIDLPDVDPQEP